MFGSRRTDSTPNGPSRAFVVSASFLGLVALALVGVLVYAFVVRPSPTPAVAAPSSPTPGRSAPAPAASTPPGASTTTAAPAPVGNQNRPAGCATTGTDQTVPVNPIAGIRWTLVDGFAVPFTAADGPTIRGAADIGYCYSRTPVGVVLAASNFGHGTGSAQPLINSVIAHTVVPGPLTSQVAATPASSVPGGGIQLAGFRVITYSPMTASVALALGSSTGAGASYSTVTLVLEWSGGDWRVVTQPGPGFFLNQATAPSLAGFVSWSGVR